MKSAFVAAASFVLLGLSACSTPAPENPASPRPVLIGPNSPFFDPNAPRYVPRGLNPDAQALADAPDLGAAMKGLTVRYFNANLGNHVFYYSETGAAYLWQPGKLEVAQLRWAVEPSPITPSEPAVCLIGPGKDSAGKVVTNALKQCESYARFLTQVQETAKGDVLKLARGTAPFLLDADKDFEIADGVKALAGKP
jgi:hypothetical protein